MPTVGFLHTSPVHVPTFRRLVAELIPGAPIVSVENEAVLDLARERGPGNDDVRREVADLVGHLVDAGATTIVCTCSTIGDVAEDVGAELGLDVVRVDRPMAERAMQVGGRVVVVAAVESTLGPTRELLESVADAHGSDVVIDVRLVDGAWERFEAGDDEGYVAAIADALPELATEADVIVLAQASMAPAAALVEVGVPVLSSPRLAVEALAR